MYGQNCIAVPLKVSEILLVWIKVGDLPTDTAIPRAMQKEWQTNDMLSPFQRYPAFSYSLLIFVTV